jgi:hypothetical protein
VFSQAKSESAPLDARFDPAEQSFGRLDDHAIRIALTNIHMADSIKDHLLERLDQALLADTGSQIARLHNHGSSLSADGSQGLPGPTGHQAFV